MPEKMDCTKILELAARLMNVTTERGASPTEAAVAMETLRSMLDKYQLSMLDVSAAERKKGWKVQEEHFYSDYENLPSYYKHLVHLISTSFDVKLVFGKEQHKGKRRQKIYFFGQELDCVVSSYLYHRTADELWNWSARDAKASACRCDSNFRANYIFAAAEQIGKRLRESREKEKVVVGSKVGALMVIKQEMIRDFISERFPQGLQKGRGYSISSGAGTLEGRERGSKMDLNTRGVEDKTSNNRRIE